MSKNRPSKFFWPVLFFLTHVIGGDVVFADDPTIVVNPEKGKWDKASTNRITLHTDLTIGVRDGDERLVFGRPTKIVVDSKDNFYVLDHGYQRIRKYNERGEYLLTVGRQGEGPGEYPDPLTIAVDQQDRLYVAGLGTRIVVYDESGSYLKEFRHDFPGSVVKSLAADSRNNVYLVCIDLVDQKMIHKYSDRDEYLFSFCESYAVGMDIDTRVENIYAGGAICIDSMDNVLYTQSAPYEIRKYSPDGKLLAKIFRENSFLPPPPDLDVNNGGRVVVSSPTTSTAVILFDDGTFINVVRQFPQPKPPGMVFIDYFNPDGELLTQVIIERNMDIECRDSLNRLYAVEMEEYPRVIRYSILEK